MTDDPVVERLADHSDMLATLTDIVAKLTHRVERLEQLEADNVHLNLEAAGLHDFDIDRAIAQARREVPDD